MTNSSLLITVFDPLCFTGCVAIGPMTVTRDREVYHDLKGRIEDNFAQMDPHLRYPTQSELISIIYHLYHVGERWLIYDIAIANVRMVRNDRTQFDRILSRASYEALIQARKSKLAPIDASSIGSATNDDHRRLAPL